MFASQVKMLEEELSVIGQFSRIMPECSNTFCRHAMLVDQKTEEVVVPLNESLTGGRIELANSEFPELRNYHLG